MRRFINPFFGLVLLGLSLAAIHAWQGITTDEAKYLLNIPYPHPPFIRSIFGFTSALIGQELFWRCILAVSLLQGTWLASACAQSREHGAKLLLAGLWILSSAVLVWSGSVLLAPVTALQMLVFCYWLLRNEDLERIIGWMALFWLASLFTAYQALLFIPIVASVFWRMQLPKWQRLLALCGPILLLALYTATNPLAVASMVTAGGQNLGAGSLLSALRGALWLWILGGSLAASVLGTIGMLASRRWPLIFSMLLVAAFISVSFRPYYAILFAPLFIAGVASAPMFMRRAGGTLLCTLACALVLVPMAFPKMNPSPVSVVYAAAQQAKIPAGATAIIAGDFGHEWQYGPYVVHRMISNPHLLDSARVAVCRAECHDIRGRAGWQQLTGVSVETWVRPIR
ncbi:hypothetical protein AUJ46_02480 [Candidatus Peregrinibacteria bacterium CG1_02_54_53]|nr:MAG: hypothetical protein AUJ46_02480 [Candidatus Peregrinibacteria bacterium CG1_02_54_53]